MEGDAKLRDARQYRAIGLIPVPGKPVEIATTTELKWHVDKLIYQRKLT